MATNFLLTFTFIVNIVALYDISLTSTSPHFISFYDILKELQFNFILNVASSIFEILMWTF
jgi:hypothetical protein